MDFVSWKTEFKFGECNSSLGDEALKNDKRKINNKINRKCYYFYAIYNKKINLQKIQTY